MCLLLFKRSSCLGSRRFSKPISCIINSSKMKAIGWLWPSQHFPCQSLGMRDDAPPLAATRDTRHASGLFEQWREGVPSPAPQRRIASFIPWSTPQDPCRSQDEIGDQNERLGGKPRKRSLLLCLGSWGQGWNEMAAAAGHH